MIKRAGFPSDSGVVLVQHRVASFASKDGDVMEEEPANESMQDGEMSAQQEKQGDLKIEKVNC